MSYIAPLGEQSTSTEIEALVNLTALGIGLVRKTGTNTFETSDYTTSIEESTSGIYKMFDFGSTPVKLKVKNATGDGYTYLTFQDGQIIASDS